MPTVSQGASQTLNLGANDSYRVTIADGGDAYVDLLSGAPGSPYQSPRLRAPKTSMLFGPYGVPAVIRIRSMVGVVTYEQVGQQVALRVDTLTKKVYTATGDQVDVGGAPVSVSGTVAVGQSLTITPAAGWQITGGQWYRDAAAISGATGLVYAVQPADAAAAISFVPTGLPFKVIAGTVPAAPPLRAVATNTNFPNNYSTVYKQMMTRRRHVVQVRITGIALRLVNTYTDPATWTELGSGASTTFSTGLEKGGVNLGNLKLAGNASMVVADLAQADTDILPVDLFPGDVVFEREYKTNPNGILYEGNNVSGNRPNYNDAANGEACYAAASGIVDQSGGVGALSGGTNVPTAMGGCFALIGYHNGVAVCVLGDSIEVGIGEAMSASNARGISHVAIAALGLPVGKVAQGGDGAVKFLASNTKRRAAMAGIFTHVLCNYVFNDIVNFAQTPAQVAAAHTSISGLLPGIAYGTRTCSPYATSTDGFATTANQTPVAAGTQLSAANDLLRALPSGVTKCWETGDAMATGRNTNIWKADGNVANRRTADNVHPTRVSGDDVVAAGVFKLADFAVA